MDACAPEGRKLELDMRRALRACEFEVHYQPIINIETRQKIMAEALIRWRHPVQGLISPDLFIPLAEATGLIDQLGTLVLRQACTDAVSWPSHTKVAVNLSPVQFRSPELGRDVARILSETGLPPQRLELEITESVLLHGSEKNIGTLHELHGLGVSIALDDFGTGYSSLSYLRTFPFDKIKIDRSFVSEMSQVDVCAAIVCAVANLGRSLGIVTTGEGVETEVQFDLLRAAGCTQAQGYLFGRPCPVAELDFGDERLKLTSERSSHAAEDHPVTARDIMLVRSSFALVVPIQDIAAGLFYDRLFAKAPELRPLFSSDLSEQKRKLMAVLSTCIGKLNDLAALGPVLRGLGARHVAYGTQPAHYAFVGDALLWTLEQGLAEAFTPEIRRAWTRVYTLLSTTMLAGAADVAPVRVARAK